MSRSSRPGPRLRRAGPPRLTRAGSRAAGRPRRTGRARGRRRRRGWPASPSRALGAVELGAQSARRGSPRPGPRRGPGGRRMRAAALPGGPVPVDRGEQLGDALAGRGRRDEDLGLLGAVARRRRRAGRSARPRARVDRAAAPWWPRRSPPGRASIARSCAAVRWAPGRSPLLTTTMSATSSRPALIAWTSSPISGASRTTVVSAAAATSTSLWPVPTVSSRIRSKPAASRTAAAAADVEASPPAWPREAIERMKTSSSRGVRLHPDAIAEERPAGDRARGVDRDDGRRCGRPPGSPR